MDPRVCSKQVGLDLHGNNKGNSEITKQLERTRTLNGTKGYIFCEGVFHPYRPDGIHLVPTNEARTWEKKGSKYILVHGIEDKRQITVSVFSSANGNLLSFQVVFTGTADKNLPLKILIGYNAKGLDGNLHVLKTIGLACLLAKNLWKQSYKPTWNKLLID
jgi:hypothetical protein